MGCWNGTCGLTGLPIFHDDPVVAMVIQRERYKDSEARPSYPWELWTPATLLVRSKYNDYGGIEVNEPITALLKLTQDQASSTMDLIDFEGHDKKLPAMIKIPTFNIEEVEDGHDEYDLYRQKSDDFALWMAHAAIFDEMRETIRGSSYETRFRSMSLKKMSDLVATKNRAKDAEARKSFDDAEDSTNERAFMMAMARMDNPWADRGSGFNGAAARFLADYISETNLTEGAEAEYDSGIVEWRSLHELYNMMMTLRITLAPPGAGGSQDDDLKSYSARNRAINAQIKRAKSRFE